ncbi:MAG TPA: flagellar motor switch protein FliM [Clostridia bacterium]|nr:flagellar motor switch protein FliM [Clostridia bacterium]
MSEVLSQNQIDDLLSALKSGDITDLDSGASEKKARPYDFKIPKKFNKEQLKTLSIIYENYGRVLSSYLSGSLRTYCQVEVLSIEEQRYFEYSNALSENIMMGIMEMQPLQGTAMITIGQTVAFAIIDRLLGGQGQAYEIDREYTDIETALMERVVRDLCTLMKDAWSNVREITPKFIRLDTNSRQTQLVSPNETVVIIAMNIKIKDVEGNISFCMPYVILEPVLEHLNTKYWFTERKISEEDRRHSKESLLRKLKRVPIEMKVVLGSSQVTLNEIMGLQAGDVIRLDQSQHENAVVMSNTSKWFTGQLGVLNNHIALKVNQVLLEGGDTDGSGTKLNENKSNQGTN